MARPDREVIVMVGDGSYLMLNNEIATSVMLDKKLIIVLLDNRGYGCINRLQQSCGSKPFNNMSLIACSSDGAPGRFRGQRGLAGALSEKVANIRSWKPRSNGLAPPMHLLICIDTDDTRTTGNWWGGSARRSSRIRRERLGCLPSRKKNRNASCSTIWSSNLRKLARNRRGDAEVRG
jgi:3D-(3,5/4)-trihydroxycyclohexane-1,2-dione acylhydrolase (decyclizing)